MKTMTTLALMLLICLSVQADGSRELAKTLFGIFTGLPTTSETRHLEHCKDKQWLISIAKNARDSNGDGVYKVGVDLQGTSATLWMVTKPASMSGRAGFYTVKFVKTNTGWLAVDGSVIINSPTALPKDLVAKCTILATGL